MKWLTFENEWLTFEWFDLIGITLTFFGRSKTPNACFLGTMKMKTKIKELNILRCASHV